MQGTELCCVGARSALQSKFVFICMAARQFVSFNLRTVYSTPFLCHPSATLILLITVRAQVLMHRHCVQEHSSRWLWVVNLC